MSELTDDQLDGLFRKSAEEFDPPFDPAAWPDMKARLDTHDGNPSGGLLPVWTNLLRWGLPLVLLLLLTGGGWYVYNRTTQLATKTKIRPTNAVSQATQQQITAKSQRRANQVATNEPARNAVADSPEAPVDATKELAVLADPATESRVPDKPLNKPENRAGEPVSAVIANATNNNKSTYKTKTEVSRTPAARLTIPVSVANERVNGKRRTDRVGVRGLSAQKQTRVGRKRKKMALSEMSYLMPSVALNSSRLVGPANQKMGQITPSEITGNLPSPAVEQTESVSLPALSALRIRPAHWPALSPLADRPVIAQPDTVAHKVVPKPVVQRGLSVRFVVAPDLSSVGLKNFSRPGTNVGLLLEYRLASRWSVQAGVIQSTKVYRGTTSDYGSWPEYVKQWKVQPEGVDGRCIMFDIPLNVRYDFALKPRIDGYSPSRWFVSGGVTSYIMKQEDYTYQYSDYTHVYPNMREAHDTNGGGYGFSNLNFSVGYERAISRRLSWQVEPFIKAPLKGVGYFKTNLLSTGVFFSIRYKL